MIRLATANAASGRDRGAYAFAAWARSAAGLGADVIGVQEVDHLLTRSGAEDQTRTLAVACGGDHAAWHARFAAAVVGTPGDRETFGPASAAGAEEPSYGVAIVSRHPVEEWWELRLPPSRASLPMLLPPQAPQRLLWVPDEPRAALAARVRAPAGGLTVVTTHLSFSPPRAVAQLREVVAWARDLPAPVVLLGDLNLPGRVPAAVSGWSAAARVATYPAAGPRVQLDHVLLANGSVLRVADAQARRVGGSDHLALVVDLDAG